MAEQPDSTQLLENHRCALRLIARFQMPAWLRPKLDPSDLVQQTMLEAHREAARIAAMPEHERAAYLRRCLNHNLIDAVRKHRHAQSELEIRQSSVRIESWIVGDASLPEERLVREERLRTLAGALALLPENQRTVVEWKHLQGLSVSEIARRMGCTESAVSGLLRRGVRALRDRLGTDFGANNVFADE